MGHRADLPGRWTAAQDCVAGPFIGSSRIIGGEDAATATATGLGWAYPFNVARLPAPSALTAAYFFLGKSRQNRWLLHTALRYASGPLAPAPSGATRPTTCFAKSTSRVFGYAEGAAHCPYRYLHSAS